MKCTKCKFYIKHVMCGFEYVICSFWPGEEDWRVIDPDGNALICPIESRSHLIRIK